MKKKYIVPETRVILMDSNPFMQATSMLQEDNDADAKKGSVTDFDEVGDDFAAEKWEIDNAVKWSD